MNVSGEYLDSDSDTDMDTDTDTDSNSNSDSDSNSDYESQRDKNKKKFINFCEKDNLSCAKYLYYTYLNCTSVLTDGLYQACKYNSYSIVEWSLDHVTTITNDLMRICIMYNRYKIFKLLVDTYYHYAPPHILEIYLTACKNNKTIFIEYLYKNTIHEQKIQVLNMCFTSYIYFIHYNLNTVKLLIELGANPRINNDIYFKSTHNIKKYDITTYLCSVVDNYLFEDNNIKIMTDEELLKYKMDLSKKHISMYKEELIQFTWHPSRFYEWCLSECDKI